MNKTQLFLKAHSPTILTIIGSIGVISTAILAVMKTPEALKLIDEAKMVKQLEKEQDYIHIDNKKHEVPVIVELTKLEMIQAAWKAYIPAIISGITTIACIAGANYLNIKKQQSLTSAYILLDNVLKEYRKKMSEQYGNDTEEIYNEITRKQFEEAHDIYKETLFFEFNSCRFFEANIHKVLQAECKALMQFETYGHLSLNDYYSYIGIDLTPYGEAQGWSEYQMEFRERMKYPKLEFKYERNIMSNGLVVYNIITNVEPTDDLYCF